MDILTILETFGVPVAVAIGMGFFIWKNQRFLQTTLMQRMDQDSKRLEGIIIKLIDQQKKIQIENRALKSNFNALVYIISSLSGNGLKEKFKRFKK